MASKPKEQARRIKNMSKTGIHFIAYCSHGHEIAIAPGSELERSIVELSGRGHLHLVELGSGQCIMCQDQKSNPLLFSPVEKMTVLELDDLVKYLENEIAEMELFGSGRVFSQPYFEFIKWRLDDVYEEIYKINNGIGRRGKKSPK